VSIAQLSHRDCPCAYVSQGGGVREAGDLSDGFDAIDLQKRLAIAPLRDEFNEVLMCRSLRG
jgi:hypothetical protein